MRTSSGFSGVSLFNPFGVSRAPDCRQADFRAS